MQCLHYVGFEVSHAAVIVEEEIVLEMPPVLFTVVRWSEQRSILGLTTGDLPYSAAQFTDGLELVGKAKIITHHSQVVLCELKCIDPPKVDPEILIHELSPPFKAKGLHGITRGAAAQEQTRLFFFTPVELGFIETDGAEHRLEWGGEAHDDVAVLAEQARGGGLAGANRAAESDDAGGGHGRNPASALIVMASS